MNCDDTRARVHRAQLELDAAQQQLAARWKPWRERVGRHKLSLLIGGGLLGGLGLATVAPKRWARVGAILFGGSAWLARSAIAPTLLGILWTSIQRPSASARSSEPARPVAPSA